MQDLTTFEAWKKFQQDATQRPQDESGLVSMLVKGVELSMQSEAWDSCDQILKTIEDLAHKLDSTKSLFLHHAILIHEAREKCCFRGKQTYVRPEGSPIRIGYSSLFGACKVGQTLIAALQKRQNEPPLPQVPQQKAQIISVESEPLFLPDVVLVVVPPRSAPLSSDSKALCTTRVVVDDGEMVSKKQDPEEEGGDILITTTTNTTVDRSKWNYVFYLDPSNDKSVQLISDMILRIAENRHALPVPQKPKAEEDHPATDLMIVTEFFDIRSREPKIDKSMGIRGASNYLELGVSLLSWPVNMMIFTEPKFVKKIQLMRQKHAPHHKTMVVPMYIEDSIFYSHLQDMITLFQEGRIPLGYNPEKDTAYYVWCMWQKFDCVARALEINPWNAARTYFIDFGIYHVAKPAELSDLLDQFQKCPRLKMTLLLPKDVKTLFKKAYDQFVFDVQARDSNNKSNKSNQVNNKRAGFPCRANTFPREQWYSRKRQSAGGGVFGGPNAYVAWFCREFMIQATEVLKKYRWSPLDESVMTTIMMDNPEKCLVIIADHPEMLLVKPDDQIFISTDSFLHNGEFDRAQDCLKECSKVASEDPKYFKLLQRSQLLVLPSVQKSSDQPPTIAGTPPQNQPPTSAAHHHPSSDKAQKTCDCACCQREQETEKNQSVTMVTAYWEVVNTTTTTVRPASFYMESALQLMNIPSPMIIYTTEPFGSTLMAKRKELGFEAQTLIKDISKRLEPERWIPLIEANRAIYWPSRDSRAPAMVHLINCLGKTLSMMDAIETNPFRTTHVAWFDFGLARSGFSDRKFNLDLATRWVNTPKPEKVRILQMRDIAPRLLQDCLHEIKTYYNDPSLKTTQERIKKCTALRQLYSRYRFGYAGNLWSSGVQTGLLFCRSMQDLFVKLTYLGFGHSEEIFVALLHEEQPDLFSIAFGDYQNVFENFYRPSHNQAFLQNLALEAKTHGRLELFNTISNLLKSNCQSK